MLTTWARSEATDIRILLSVLLLAPPAFCMGMMFPLGLSIWRRHSELLPFFWSANGITSMFASVLGMALSIEFGIARTYALGVGFYVVCAVNDRPEPASEPRGRVPPRGRSRNRIAGLEEVDAAAASIAPSTNRHRLELATASKTA